MSASFRGTCLGLLVLLSVLTVFPIRADATPRVELVTIDPGDDIFNRFGHVVLRVIDPETGQDDAFSYGHAPFDQPDFMWDYIRGEAHFFVAKKPWSRALDLYQRQNRTVHRRPLNLTQGQTQALVARLDSAVQPENREYLYDHLFDNCSTKVRDLLDEFTAGSLRRAAERTETDATFRTFTLQAGSGQLLTQIVFDLIGGPNQEVAVDGWSQMYLPVFLDQVASEARVMIDNREVPLAGSEEIIYEREGPPPTSGQLYLGRWTVAASGLGLFVIFFFGGRLGRSGPNLVTRVAGLALIPTAIVFGVLGAGLSGLVAVSDVADFRWNENVLIFVPFDLSWAITGFSWMIRGRSDCGTSMRLYLFLRVGVLVASVGAKLAGILPQDNWAFLTAGLLTTIGLLLGVGLWRQQPRTKRAPAR